jgi:hypothetical protein
MSMQSKQKKILVVDDEPDIVTTPHSFSCGLLSSTGLATRDRP